jgi:Holliday junction resolvasome RuvABC ATP-dependent DNA helicase subunit
MDEIALARLRHPTSCFTYVETCADFAEVRADGVITRQVSQDALELLDVDVLGLMKWTARVVDDY